MTYVNQSWTSVVRTENSADVIQDKEIKAIDKNKWIWLFLTAVVTFATWVFYYLALSKNDAYKVASLEKISIIIVFILSFFVLNEKITILGILGMILILVGSIMTSL